MEKISKVKNLKSNGHYSLATIHGDTVYVSGQLSFDPETGEQKHGTVEEETLQVLQNIELILNEAGSKKEKILRMTLYIPDMKNWDIVNRVYSEFFGEHKPARTIVPTKDLHFGFNIEIEAIAYI